MNTGLCDSYDKGQVGKVIERMHSYSCTRVFFDNHGILNIPIFIQYLLSAYYVVGSPRHWG